MKEFQLKRVNNSQICREIYRQKSWVIYKNKITNKFMDIVRQTELQTDNLLTDKITDRELQSRVTD